MYFFNVIFYPSGKCNKQKDLLGGANFHAIISISTSMRREKSRDEQWKTDLLLWQL